MKKNFVPAFTLIEILLAAAIFSGAMILMVGVISGNVKNQLRTVNERKIVQGTRLFEETFTRKIREATGSGTYTTTGVLSKAQSSFILAQYIIPSSPTDGTTSNNLLPPSAQPPVSYQVRGIIGINSQNNFRPTTNDPNDPNDPTTQNADILLLFKPKANSVGEIEVLKAVKDASIPNTTVFQIQSWTLPDRNLVSDTELNGLLASQIIFPQQGAYLSTDNNFPFQVNSDIIDSTSYQNSLVTLIGKISNDSAQCLNNNRSFCFNVNTKVSVAGEVNL